MDLTNIATIKFLLKKYGIRPNKRLGQNFLIDREVLSEIMSTIYCSSEVENIDSFSTRPDVHRDLLEEYNDLYILEIGPGLGTLTRELCKRAKQVIAVEKDPAMCEILRETCSEFRNLKIIEKDILKVDISQIIQKSKCKMQNDKSNFKIVGNIPYSITSPLIRKLVTCPLFLVAILMVQKEVAERICAKEGESERGFLSVLVQYYTKPEIIRLVSRDAFWPKPEVESAILRIIPYCHSVLDTESRQFRLSSNGIEARIVKRLSSSLNETPKRYRNKPRNRLTKPDDDFFRLVKIGFSARRKTLANNLSAGLKISKQETAEIMARVGLDPRSRAQDLSIENWEKLLETINC